MLPPPSSQKPFFTHSKRFKSLLQDERKRKNKEITEELKKSEIPDNNDLIEQNSKNNNISEKKKQKNEKKRSLPFFLADDQEEIEEIEEKEEKEEKEKNNSNKLPYSVILKTKLGKIEIILDHKHAPLACYNFYRLSQIGYYDNTVFHRLVKGFLIQGGDPTGTGKHGDSIFKDHNEYLKATSQLPVSLITSTRYFPDEINHTLSHDRIGVVGMANSGLPNTNASQFYITLGSCTHLDGTSTIFGHVAKHSLRILKKFITIKTNKAERPLENIYVEKAEINMTKNDETSEIIKK